MMLSIVEAVSVSRAGTGARGTKDENRMMKKDDGRRISDGSRKVKDGRQEASGGHVIMENPQIEAAIPGAGGRILSQRVRGEGHDQTYGQKDMAVLELREKQGVDGQVPGHRARAEGGRT